MEQDFADYRSLISQKLKATLLGGTADPGSNYASTPAHDDDTHYFQSYGENGS